MLSLFHTQVLQQLSSLAFSLPTIHFGKLQLQVGSAIAVLLAHLRLRIEGLTLLHVLPKWLVSHQHRVHNGEFIILEVVLREYREAFANAQFHRTLVGFQLTADGLEQRRFSCSVGTDDTVDVTTCELDVYVFVEYALSELDGKVCDCDHIVLYLIIIVGAKLRKIERRTKETRFFFMPR